MSLGSREVDPTKGNSQDNSFLEIGMGNYLKIRLKRIEEQIAQREEERLQREKQIQAEIRRRESQKKATLEEPRVIRDYRRESRLLRDGILEAVDVLEAYGVRPNEWIYSGWLSSRTMWSYRPKILRTRNVIPVWHIQRNGGKWVSAEKVEKGYTETEPARVPDYNPPRYEPAWGLSIGSDGNMFSWEGKRVTLLTDGQHEIDVPEKLQSIASFTLQSIERQLLQSK